MSERSGVVAAAGEEWRGRGVLEQRRERRGGLRSVQTGSERSCVEVLSRWREQRVYSEGRVGRETP